MTAALILQEPSPRAAHPPDARRGRFVDVLLLTNETRWQETVGASLHDTARPCRLPRDKQQGHVLTLR